MTLKELEERVFVTPSFQSEMVNVEIVYRGKRYKCLTYDPYLGGTLGGTKKQKLEYCYRLCKSRYNLGEFKC